MMDCDSERIWKIVENQRHNIPKKKRPPGTSLSLFDRLYDCYVECAQKQNDKNFDKRFRNTVNLLQQLSPDHTHPSLVVNLYSDERGYSLVLNPDGQTNEVFLPYEDNEIFSYLDDQEIPPVLMEVLSRTNHCHMYGGCIVCEVRNYRLSSTSPSSPSRHSYDSHLIMLRPTTESILQMVNEIASETSCSLEDQLVLESKLVLATQPPICLDPSTEVVWVTNRLHYNRRKFHSPAMRRYLRRRSQARRAQMYHTSLHHAPPELRLHKFLTTSNIQLKCPRPQFSDVWKRRQPLDLTLPTTSASTIAKSVQDLATVLPEPLPPLVASPTANQQLPQTPTPLLHIRAQGQKLAEEFLDSGGRQPSSAAAPHLGGSRSTSSVSSPPPHPSPTHNTTPTIVRGADSQPLPVLHTQLQPPQPPLTISLPQSFFTLRSKVSPPHTLPSSLSQPTPSTSQLQQSTPSLPHTHTTSHTQPTLSLPPTSLMRVMRTRPIAPRPHPVASMVAVTAGKTTTSQHPTAALRSSPGVITLGNQQPVTTTQVVGRRTVGLLTMPKLQRPPHLPPLSIQHTLTSMPKLYRFSSPHHPTPPLSLHPRAPSYPPPHPPSPSLPTPTSTRGGTPLMPVLHRLATGNGAQSPALPPPVSKMTPPTLKASPFVVKLKKLQMQRTGSS